MSLFIFPWLAIGVSGADQSPKEVVALWRQLPQLAKDTPNKAYRDLDTWLPNRGLRGLYAKAQFALNVAQLEKLSDHKIFRAGPHRNGKLDLNAEGDFGHYNPAFLKWALQNGIPGRHDAKLRKELQLVYEKFLKRTARHYFRTHKLLQTMPARAAKARDGYAVMCRWAFGCGVIWTAHPKNSKRCSRHCCKRTTRRGSSSQNKATPIRCFFP